MRRPAGRVRGGRSRGAAAGEYAEWVAGYREGRFVESARRAFEVRPEDAVSAQRAFLDGCPPPGTPVGFRQRLAAALLHAEGAARFRGAAALGRLTSRPIRSLEEGWPPGLPSEFREEAGRAWGRSASDDLRRLVNRELHLAVGRMLLSRLDLGGARSAFDAGGPRSDPALAWQRAALDLLGARYLRQEDLWKEAGSALVQAVRRRGWSREEAAASDRATARAMGTPADLHLRTALAELGQGDYDAAERSLARVVEPVPRRLLAPLRLLAAESAMRRRPGEAEIPPLREAVSAFPSSPAAVAALVAAMQDRGLGEAAAELAGDFLSQRDYETPWLDFLTTWAEAEEPGLSFLRRLAA